MTPAFDDAVVTAVLHHMNNDHRDDNLLIARAFADAEAVSARMTGFDGDAGDWEYEGAEGTAHTVRVPWPAGRITERPEVRREIVALYDDACERLGIEPRPHA